MVGIFIVGTADADLVELDPGSMIVGTLGAETEILGESGKLMVGTDGVAETFILGTGTFTLDGALESLFDAIGVGLGRAGTLCFWLFGRRSNGDLLRT